MLFLFDVGLGLSQKAVLLGAHVEGIIVRQPVKDVCVCVCVCVYVLACFDIHRLSSLC